MKDGNRKENVLFWHSVLFPDTQPIVLFNEFTTSGKVNFVKIMFRLEYYG